MEEIAVIIIGAAVFGIPYLFHLYFHIESTEAETAVQTRLPYFDYLKGVAILAVILIHVKNMYERYIPVNDFSFLYITNNVLRFAIPFFLICSGILLNPNFKEGEGALAFYSKKILRIFLPYTLFTLGVALYHDHLDIFWRLLGTGEASPPYYFMLVLLQCYLLYPLLVKYKNNKKELLAFSFLLSLLSFFSPITWYFAGIPTVFPYLFFFVYGFAKRNDFLNYKKNFHEFVGWLCITVLYLLVVYMKPALFYNSQFFYGVALFSIFFYFKEFFTKSKILNKTLIYLGKNSLWIYLLHFFILQAIVGRFQTITKNYYLDFFVFFILAVAVTIPAAWLVKKIYDYFFSLLNTKKQKTL